MAADLPAPGVLSRGRLLLHWARGGCVCGASRRPTALLSPLLRSRLCSHPGRPWEALGAAPVAAGPRTGAPCGSLLLSVGEERRVQWAPHPTPRLRSRAGCLQKQSLELCVSDHSVGVQGPHSSSIVRYVCTFQPSNLINGLCKNREVQSLKESLLFLLCFNLAYNKPVDETVTSRLVSEGTGQRLDSAREPGVCPWSSEWEPGAWVWCLAGLPEDRGWSLAPAQVGL